LQSDAAGEFPPWTGYADDPLARRRAALEPDWIGGGDVELGGGLSDGSARDGGLAIEESDDGGSDLIAARAHPEEDEEEVLPPVSQNESLPSQ
jgi:hypothetical protein